MTPTTNQIAPEDVRPGVWVIYEGLPVKVSSISLADIMPAEYIVEAFNESFAPISVPLSDCSPVPLSEGVIHATNLHEYEWLSIELHEDLCEISIDGQHLTDQCNQLHKLQNLIRAVDGSDLQINAAQLLEAVKLKNND